MWVLKIYLALMAPEPIPHTANYEAEHRVVYQIFAAQEQCEAEQRRWTASEQTDDQAARELLGLDPSEIERGYFWMASDAECLSTPRTAAR